MKTKMIILSLILMLGVTLDVSGQPYNTSYDAGNFSDWNFDYVSSEEDILPNDTTINLSHVTINSNQNIELHKEIPNLEYLNQDSDIDLYYKVTLAPMSKVEVSIYTSDDGVNWINIQDSIIDTSDFMSYGMIEITVEVDTTLSYNNISYFKIEIKDLLGTGYLINITSFKLDYTVDGFASINTQNPLEDEIRVYSNNKSIYISSDDYLDTEIMIYNMNGQLVRNEFLNINNSPTEINLSENQAGMYIVVISDGENVKREKVVIN